MTRAVIAGIHHHELLRQPMHVPERPASRFVVSDKIIMRPRRKNGYGPGGNAFVNDTLLHETVERDNPVRASQAVFQKRLQYARDRGVLPHPAQGYTLVRIQVHDPKAKP